MTELPISELTLGDVGRRVILTHDGSPTAGLLKSVSAYGHKEFGLLREKKSIIIKSIRLSMQADTGIDISFDSVPVDYLIQVDRGSTPSDSEPTR